MLCMGVAPKSGASKIPMWSVPKMRDVLPRPHTSLPDCASHMNLPHQNQPVCCIGVNFSQRFLRYGIIMGWFVVGLIHGLRETFLHACHHFRGCHLYDNRNHKINLPNGGGMIISPRHQECPAADSRAGLDDEGDVVCSSACLVILPMQTRLFRSCRPSGE